MDDELENFIRERKARVAEDKACLEQDPPYMEIRAKPCRAYGSTVKENIPPRIPNQGKDESCSVGLPLGAEYEKKKHRLQHELRMDYRRYMAQKSHLDPVDSGPLIIRDNRRSIKLQPELLTDVFKQRGQRDAAALTWDRGLHRALRLAGEDQDPLLFPHRHSDELGSQLDLDSEEEEERFKDQLEKTGARRGRPIRAEASYQTDLSAGTDGREKGEHGAGTWSHSRRSRELSKNENAPFATGLIIGAADTGEALQRKKERYRQELQEQIAEQHRNKKREKDLELKVAATGANDPEKPPNRIRQFGLSRRDGSVVTEPSASAESGSSSRTTASNERGAVRGREMPPPELPHAAFQSPLLEYSSALSLGEGHLSPSSQHCAPSIPNTIPDIHRNPAFLPQPPSTIREAYRSPYGEPHQYYGTRNLLDPNMAYYCPFPVPYAGFPMSYWNVPPGGAVPSQLGNHSPHNQHSGSSFPEPPLRPNNETAAAGYFPSERPRSTRDRVLSYREALKQQEASRTGSNIPSNKIQEQQERRRQERDEREHFEARLEADMKNHEPWGRGGGGAPLRDSKGNLIADLNQMHKLNEEAYSNPELWQRRAAAAMMPHRAEHPHPTDRITESSSYDTADRLPGFTHVQTPQFARGKVFAIQPSEHQLQEQDKYKAYLKQQIDEKMRKKAEEREQIRLEEEKEERRLAEQRARIQREYEEEQERKKRKEMEQKAKNEELIQLAEQRRKEAERKKKEADEKESAALRRQYEKERQMRVEEVCREPSPPIPTLQRKHGRRQQPTPRPPSVHSQNSTAPLSERSSSSGLQSPPVPARRNQLRAAGDHHDVFSELSALRRQLRSEQKRLESELQQGKWEELDSPVNVRDRPAVDVFDMARLRLQAPVRRPNSQNTEPRNLLRIHDSLQLKYTDGESRMGSGEDTKLEEEGVVSRRSRDYRDAYHHFISHRSALQDDYYDLSPPEQNDYLRSVSGASRRSLLLESESAFIDHLGEASPVPPTPEHERVRQLSARERRRLAKQTQRPQERAASNQPVVPQRNHPDPSGTRRNLEEAGCELRSLNRTGQLMAFSRREPMDVSDGDSSPPELSPLSLNRESSEDTVTTDSWFGAGTSDTLKRLDRPSRRKRLST
ncbi:centrosome and spindle pole associated protein 1-like isoform X2 [Girardinichthys multiradiatus]|uniref:centrosome and spindle pole associated protein 1-like isoform X2 n=1 Tax=Girardinichthys multiradiatus TaxID=208333 RepID=UPI001FAC0332|nr:centrosome and spindle pole associated protein 1-like isoform X2 [Girardinichthys multiradiatus]